MSIAVEVSGGPAGLEPLAVRAVQATLAHHAIVAAEISVALLGDAEIAALNKQYLQHDYVTDVISFPLWEAGEPVVGDIYIGLEQARRQSAEAGVSYEEELARLVVHGTLHVLHYDHPGDESRFQSDMWAVQEKIVSEMRGIRGMLGMQNDRAGF